MANLTVDDIFERIYADEMRVKVYIKTKQEAESLRVQLAKRHREIRALEPDSTDSLCSSFNPTEQIAEFWIGKKKVRKGFFTLAFGSEVASEESQSDATPKQGSAASQL